MSESVSKSRALEELAAAFEGVAHPKWSEVWKNHPMGEHLFRNVFAFPDEQRMLIELPETAAWDELSPKAVGYFAPAYLLCAPHAFKFFIAALLAAAIRDPESVDAGTSTLAATLANYPSDAHSAAQFAELTPAQFDAVRTAVAYLANNTFNEFECTQQLVERWRLK